MPFRAPRNNVQWIVDVSTTILKLTRMSICVDLVTRSMWVRSEYEPVKGGKHHGAENGHSVSLKIFPQIRSYLGPANRFDRIVSFETTTRGFEC